MSIEAQPIDGVRAGPLGAFRPDLLAGKTAFVAGGTSGLNLGIASALVSLGAKVTVIGRNAERAAAAALSLGAGALGIACDVREYDAVEGAFATAAEAFGPIDIVISGAAGNFFAPAAQMSARAFRVVVDIDLLGTFNVFRACRSVLRAEGASLVAISAPQADIPRAQQAHACAAKAGVNQLVRTLALEWGREGVRVNAISPGPVADSGALNLLPPGGVEKLVARLPLARLASAEDVAAAVVFLSSAAGDYVTGAILPCDGGLLLGDPGEP